jgi:hypothetical protein
MQSTNVPICSSLLLFLQKFDVDCAAEVSYFRVSISGSMPPVVSLEKHPNLADSCHRVVFAINYQPRTGEKNRARLDEWLGGDITRRSPACHAAVFASHAAAWMRRRKLRQLLRHDSRLPEGFG